MRIEKKRDCRVSPDGFARNDAGKRLPRHSPFGLIPRNDAEKCILQKSFISKTEEIIYLFVVSFFSLDLLLFSLSKSENPSSGIVVKIWGPSGEMITLGSPC